MMDLGRLLAELQRAKVEFIIVGGVAANVHGSVRVTVDFDVVYRRTPENMTRLVEALASHEPYLRGAPAGLPFRFDLRTLSHGLNFTLSTALGDIDLLGEITGGGGYDRLVSRSTEVELFGLPCLCLDLDKLIDVKRAAGRPKDLEAIAELEKLRTMKG
ncbi:MAG: hypothetical protein HY303_04325 [Candidatus Wallbacteria bacterium]|nr:hypothetical protein [Candidatus Wallbacteria bacterium]